MLRISLTGGESFEFYQLFSSSLSIPAKVYSVFSLSASTPKSKTHIQRRAQPFLKQPAKPCSKNTHFFANSKTKAHKQRRGRKNIEMYSNPFKSIQIISKTVGAGICVEIHSKSLKSYRIYNEMHIIGTY
jgi:hypothetical protein